MNQIEIVKINSEYLSELKHISEITFLETFSYKNKEEDMSLYLERNFSLSRLNEELENSNSEFYLAYYEKAPIAYLKLNVAEAQTERKLDQALEIERIYVLKDFQGKGIGKLLMNYAFQCAINKKNKWVWLGVWEENQKALDFYYSMGFRVFDSHIFLLGEDAQTDLLLKIEMT